MKNNNPADLLVDLAKLLKKHGPERFASLASLVGTPDFNLHLVEALNTIASVGRTSGSAKHARKATVDLRSEFLELCTTDPKRGEVLLALYDGLKGKTFLSSLRDLRSFAGDRELLEIKATSRDKAVAPLVRKLAQLPTPVLESYLDELQSSSIPSRGLEGWSNIILHNRHNSDTSTAGET